jgi:hypothetical protein
VERPEQALGLLGYVRLLRRVTPCALAPLSALTCLLVASPAFVQALASTPFSAPPPDAIAAPLRDLLAPDGSKVALGATTLEFWWVRTLPVSGPPAWSHVAEGTLIGAVRVSGSFKEIRGKTVKAGTYTLRLGLQPQNGDHLGVSSFREYLLLSPASADTDPKPLGFDGTVAIAKQTLGASHPAALSLDPPVATMAAGTAYTNELEHRGLVFAVPTAAGTPLKFGLILVGVIEH